jgi:hypothetical protein
VRKAPVVAVISLVAGLVAARLVLFPAPARDAGAAAPTWRVVVESRDRPAGTRGGAIDVAARGSVEAAVWEDGSITVRTGATVRRVVLPSEDERVRRAAVAPDGAVLALTSRGRLVDVASGDAVDTGLKTQTGSHVAAGPGDGDVWSVGERGVLRRFDRRTHAVAEPWEGGAPSFTALLVDAAHVTAGEGEGTVLRGPIAGGRPSEWLHLDGGITALAVAEGWVAAGSERGKIAVRRSQGLVPATAADVGGEVVGLAFAPADAEGHVERSPLLVVHAPSTATLLEGGAYERRSSTDLGATPRCACALGAGALLVGTSEGERVVRIVPSR